MQLDLLRGPGRVRALPERPVQDNAAGVVLHPDFIIDAGQGDQRPEGTYELQLELGELQVLSADDVPAAVSAAETNLTAVPAAGQHQPDPEPARGDGGLLPEQGDAEPGPADEGDSELREDALAARAARPVRAAPAELRLSDRRERDS